MTQQQTKQSDRSTELIEAVDQFNRDHHAWVNDVNREHPDAAYWDALTAMLNVWEDGEIPADCRHLQPHIDEINIQLEIFDAESTTSGSIQPNADFWEARQQLEAARVRQQSPKRHRESVAELHRQGVPHEQIANMWGLSSIAQVAQELQRPGSVIGADYVHPEDRRRPTTTENLPTAAADPSTPHAGPRRRVANKESCKETALELWALGQGANATPVSHEQAADMLGCTVAEVEAQFRQFDEEAAEAAKREAAGENDDQPAYVAPSDTSGDEPAELAGKTNDELRQIMAETGISIRANASRNTMIKKIMAARERNTAGA